MNRVVFVGNCQAQALYDGYKAFIAPARGETVDYVPAYEEATDAAREKIREADLVVLQVTDAEQKVGRADLGAGARVVLFPMVTAFFLWPFHHGAHPQDAAMPADYRKVFTGDFGDRWLDRRLARGEDTSALPEAYRTADVVGEGHVDRLIELVTQKQRERDARADMHLSDYIMSRLPTERVFLHMHHPNLGLFSLMLREVFARAGCAEVEIAQALSHYRFSPFPPNEVPVHPRISAHLRLGWAVDNLKYRFEFGERLTWDEYCGRYAAHDYNEPLQRCLALAHRDLPRVDLELLALELEPAAERWQSAEGFFALSDTRRRLGDSRGALAAVERACIGDPFSIGYAARRVEMLDAAGKRDDALGAAEDLVAWRPDFTQARINLFEMLASLGRKADALREARAAAALEPGHPHVARRLAELERDPALAS